MRTIHRFSAFATFVLLAGCAGNAPYDYKLYPGPERPASELAVIEFSWHGCYLRIDGLQVNCAHYDRILLLPGVHRLEVESYAGPGKSETSVFRTPPLEAGKVYRFKHWSRLADPVNGELSAHYVVTTILEDVATGVSPALEPWHE